MSDHDHAGPRCWYHAATKHPCRQRARWQTAPQYLDPAAVAVEFAAAVRWCDQHRHPEDVLAADVPPKGE